MLYAARVGEEEAVHVLEKYVRRRSWGKGLCGKEGKVVAHHSGVKSVTCRDCASCITGTRTGQWQIEYDGTP